MKNNGYQSKGLKESLIKGHQKYSDHLASTYEFAAEDFANVYFTNLQLLEMVERQDEMIKDIYEILDRHEKGLK